MYALHKMMLLFLLFVFAVQAQYPPWRNPYAAYRRRHNGNPDCLNAPISTENERFRDCKLHRGYTQMKYGYMYNPYDDDCKYQGYDECQIPPHNFFPSFYDCERSCLRY